MFTALFNNNILNIKPNNNSYINNSSKTNALLFFDVILNQNKKKKKKKQSIANIIDKVYNINNINKVSNINNINIINNKLTIVLIILLILSLTFTLSITNTYANNNTNNNKHSCLIQKKENGKIEYNTKYGKNCTMLRPVTLTDVNNITLNKELELNGACVLNSSDLAYYINIEKIDNKVILNNDSYSIKCKSGYTTTDGKEFVYKCDNGELIFDDENSTVDSGCNIDTSCGNFSGRIITAEPYLGDTHDGSIDTNCCNPLKGKYVSIDKRLMYMLGTKKYFSEGWDKKSKEDKVMEIVRNSVRGFIDLQCVDLSNTNFSGRKFGGKIVHFAKGGVGMSSNLSGADFSNTEFPHVYFAFSNSGSNLAGANFSKAIFNGDVSFGAYSNSGSNLAGTNFSGTEFKGNIRIITSNFCGAKFDTITSFSSNKGSAPGLCPDGTSSKGNNCEGHMTPIPVSECPAWTEPWTLIK